MLIRLCTTNIKQKQITLLLSKHILNYLQFVIVTYLEYIQHRYYRHKLIKCQAMLLYYLKHENLS